MNGNIKDDSDKYIYSLYFINKILKMVVVYLIFIFFFRSNYVLIFRDLIFLASLDVN